VNEYSQPIPYYKRFYGEITSDFMVKYAIKLVVNYYTGGQKLTSWSIFIQGGIRDKPALFPGGPSACTTLKNFDCLVKGQFRYHNDTLLQGLQRKLSICSKHGVFPIYPTKIILDTPSKI